MTQQILKIIRKYADFNKTHIKIWDKDLNSMVAELDRLYNPPKQTIKKDCQYHYYYLQTDKAHCKMGILKCPCEHYIKSQI